MFYIVQTKDGFLVFRNGLALWYAIWIAAWVYWYDVGVLGIMILDNCVIVSDIVLVGNCLD